MKTGCRVLLAAAVWGAWLVGGAQAQVLSEGLVFHAITPCRVFDTRPNQGGTGPLTPNVPATFRVVGQDGFEGQGGHPGGCGIPTGTSDRPAVQAVMFNFVAVNPSGPGNLRAWPSDQGVPNASILNFTTATTIANGVIVAVSQQGIGEIDISVRADGAATHVLADVVGYFLKQDMGSRGACYGQFCQGGSTLIGGDNYLFGDAANIADITTVKEQTCLVTADVAMNGSLATLGEATVRTAVKNITQGSVKNDSLEDPTVGFGFPTYGSSDDIGSASKTHVWKLSANSQYRFGCHVGASFGYVGDFARCHVSWICR